jgi:small multidrug resistance family-3 protein
VVLSVNKFPIVAWIIFVAAAVLEVGGDAVMRKGLRERGPGRDLPGLLIIFGGLMLAFYGFVVNTVQWDFSKLMGVYVAVFAVVSLLMGKFVFGEDVPISSWIGLGIIVVGGMVIQFGSSWPE